MKRRYNQSRWCLGLLALLLLAAGCTGSGQGTLLEDDFSTSRSGWGTDQRDEFERGYEQGGGYFFQLVEPNWLAWANPGKKSGDVSIETEAYVVSGAPDAHFGVLCRYADEDNFYYFAVSADGYYAIFRRLDGDVAILTGDGSGMTPSSAIKTGRQTNRIRAVCQGDTLTLYVNGQQLGSVTDDSLARGDVGIGAASGPGGEVRVRFSECVASQP